MDSQNQNSLNPLNTPNKHGWFANHHIMGALFIIIVFGAIVWLVYYMSYPPEPAVQEGQKNCTQADPDCYGIIPPGNDSNSKVYSSQELGVEFKYPSDWKPDTCDWPTAVYFNVICNSDAPITMALGFKNNVTIDNQIKEYVAATPMEKVTRKTIKLDSQDATWIQGDIVKDEEGPGPASGSKITMVFFQNNDRVYTLSLYQYSQSNYPLEQYNKDLELVLFDFKFIDPNIYSVKLHGGLCVTAQECESFFVFNAQGEFKYTVAGKVMAFGEVSSDQVKKIEDLIRKTDFAEIKKHEPNDVCPTDYDGQEKIYYISLANISEIIPSCAYDTTKYELFTYINRFVEEHID